MESLDQSMAEETKKLVTYALVDVKISHSKRELKNGLDFLAFV